MGIDLIVHKPRLWWHSRTWSRRQALRALSRFESRVYSQNGEDGMIAEIFGRIGVKDRYAVEFGIGDGTECCTRALLERQGWRGLLIEGSPSLAEKARAVYAANTSVEVACRFITVDTILGVFESSHVPETFDLLVIDIDGNDYWVWERILSRYRPRVVVIEYNARWIPPVRWVMPYVEDYRWDGSVMFGASLASLADLGSTRGYTLVGCDSRGVNAFFVRADLVGSNFPDAANGPGYHYAPPRYGRGFGHPVRVRRSRA